MTRGNGKRCNEPSPCPLCGWDGYHCPLDCAGCGLTGCDQCVDPEHELCADCMGKYSNELAAALERESIDCAKALAELKGLDRFDCCPSRLAANDDDEPHYDGEPESVTHASFDPEAD